MPLMVDGNSIDWNLSLNDILAFTGRTCVGTGGPCVRTPSSVAVYDSEQDGMALAKAIAMISIKDAEE